MAAGKAIKKVFVVYGHCGEYSDSRDWAICFYEDEALAQAHVEAASAREREIAKWVVDDDLAHDYWTDEYKRKCLNKWDPGQSMRSYTGVNYACVSIGRGSLKRPMGWTRDKE